ncbi:hypothetical protein ACB098_06G032400 [Castanea mollissima]
MLLVFTRALVYIYNSFFPQENKHIRVYLLSSGKRYIPLGPRDSNFYDERENYYHPCVKLKLKHTYNVFNKSFKKKKYLVLHCSCTVVSTSIAESSSSKVAAAHNGCSLIAASIDK